ncbi:transglycosylase SLT domain-containing protein [Aurantimonas aggregata]|uniref:Transglycosylase SLT domain-containing protein n=1 Tax=Aurantimonas aggregata TaxID=2047720 RepID=A0A6L9MEP8_9HYPH|nr:transglycosylase SLT domain-containing protein [Aurantimonas aggregata]NDV86217.1 transglycosylase SLT domain-containing protein [Aurantimonas aggregata]
MGSGDRAATGVQRLRLLPLAGIAALLALSGCIADGPGGSPLALGAAATEADATEKTETAEAAPATAPSEKDVKIAAREARQAAESGTISGSAALDQLIEKHALNAGIPPALAYAVVRVESRYNPKAKGAGGVYGLSQIKPATARSMGFAGSPSDLFDADTNLTYGMKYLKGAWEQGGHDVCKASMKYKGGHRTTRMSQSAARYCSAVKAHMAEVNKRRGVATPAEAAPEEEKGLLGTMIAAIQPKPASASETPAATAQAAAKVQAKPAEATATASVASPVKPSAQTAVATALAPTEKTAVPSLPTSAETTEVAAAPVPSSAKGGRVAAVTEEPGINDDALAARMGFDDEVAPLLRGAEAE